MKLLKVMAIANVIMAIVMVGFAIYHFATGDPFQCLVCLLLSVGNVLVFHFVMSVRRNIALERYDTAAYSDPEQVFRAACYNNLPELINKPKREHIMIKQTVEPILEEVDGKKMCVGTRIEYKVFGLLIYRKVVSLPNRYGVKTWEFYCN